LISALFQRKINGVVFRVNDSKKSWVPKTLRASPTIENLAVQEHADVVAIADFQFLHLLVVRLDGGARIEELHAGLGLEAGREVALKGNARMWRLTIPIQNHKSRRLRLHILPLNRVALRTRERTLQIPLQPIVRWRDAPLRENVRQHRRKMPLPRGVRRRPYFEIRKVRFSRQREQGHLALLNPAFQIVHDQ